jgi:hypothetical protein
MTSIPFILFKIIKFYERHRFKNFPVPKAQLCRSGHMCFSSHHKTQDCE